MDMNCIPARIAAGVDKTSAVAEDAIDLYPHARETSHESMVRTLDAQVRAIWPQEAPFFTRYGLPPNARVLDAGCGTGLVTAKLAELFPEGSLLGVDILEEHLERARENARAAGARISFERQSIYELQAPSGSFDLVVCRHVLHSLPHVDRILAELARVTRPGGVLHLIPEDYGMLHFQPGNPDPNDMWRTVPQAFGAATNTDPLSGRNTFGLLAGLGLRDIAVDYVIVDTVRVERETMANIFEGWRDGYADAIERNTGMPAARARALFDAMIANVRDPRGYAVWFVPVVSARISS